MVEKKGNFDIIPLKVYSYSNTNLKRYIQPYDYCSIIYNSQDMEATLGVHQQMNG